MRSARWAASLKARYPGIFVLFGLVRAVRAPSRTRTNANFFLSKSHFRQNLANLLCMHKKHTKYRFKLWYKVLKIIFFILYI
jgi:hypothetical protein